MFAIKKERKFKPVTGVTVDLIGVLSNTARAQHFSKDRKSTLIDYRYQSKSQWQQKVLDSR